MQGFGKLVEILPLDQLDPEVWALEVARAGVIGFTGLAQLGLKAAEGFLDGARLLIEKTVGFVLGLFRVEMIEVQGSLSDIMAGVLPYVKVTLRILGVRLRPTLRLDFRNVDTLAASLLDFVLSAFRPDDSSRFLPSSSPMDLIADPVIISNASLPALA